MSSRDELYGLKLKPLYPKTSQSGAPLSGGHHLIPSHQIQKMAFWHMRNRYNVTFPMFGPVASGATVNTDIDFGVSEIDPTIHIMVIPWLAHPDATKLHADIIYSMDHSELPLRISLTTQTMMSAVASVQSEREYCPPNMTPHRSNWSRHRNGRAGFGRCGVTMSPAYPADRMIGIKLSAYWGATVNNTNISTIRSVRIVSITLSDIILEQPPES